MIYLFNNKEELIHIIKEQDLIEFTHKIEINTFDAAEFELPIEAIDKEIIEQMRFFGFFVRGRQFGVFKAYEVTMSDNYVVKGLDRAESDLRTVRIIKDKRLQNVTADQALNVALEGTGYQLGEREGLTKVNKTNFYYISPREALVKIIEAFNCEFRVRYEFVENKVINRYIDLYHRQGSYSGVQFEYGNNALEVTMEEDSDNVVTALIGRGKGEESTDSEGNATGGYGRRIEFTDIVWTKASGKPIDKPTGQNYIVLNDDIENKGLYQNGELKHRWGVFVDEEIEDKEVLLQATYQELLRLNNPIRKYKASILDLRDDIWLGDRVAIVKDSAKLSFEARIFSITIDKLNFDQSEVELGDYETLKSQSQSSSLNAVKEAVRELSEEQEAYNRKVQEMIDNKNAEIAEKMRVMRLDMDNSIEDAKNKSEKVKEEISAQITGRFNDFNLRLNTEIYNQDSRISDAKGQAEAAFNQIWSVRSIADKAFEKAQQASAQALYAIDNNDKVKSELADFKKSAQKSQTTLSEEINAFKEQYGTKLNEVVNTTDGISTKIAEIKTYVDNDGNRTEELRRYVRDETSANSTSIREELSTNYINKTTYNENARTVERRFEALTSEQDAKLATYKQGIDGRFTEISSLLSGKVNQSDFQRVKENSALYERILGTSESDAPDKMSRLIMSSQIFQTEVGKYVTDDNNLIVNSMTMSTNTLVGNNNPNASVSVSDGIFTIKAQGLTGYNWSGFSLPIYVKKIYHGETYTLGFKYRIKEYPDSSFAFNIKNHDLNKILLSSDIGKNRPPLNEWQEFQKTFTVQEDFAFGEGANYPFYIFLAKNGWIEFKEPILVRGSNTGPYKPSQFDDAYKTANRTRELAEATRTQVTQLAGSYAIQNLNSAGDLISGINLGASGLNRITGKATHITGDTLIDNAVIKSAMVDKLKTGNFEAGSVTTQIIASNAVTADKLLVDSAMINKLVSNQAFIRELTSQKAFITQLASIDFSAEHIKGGRLSANTGSTVFDLDNGTLNLYSNTGTIRRIDETSSSQFLKMTRSGFIAEHFRDSNAAMIVLGTNHDKTENTNNGTFAGTRLWSGSGNGVNESFYEIVADRLAVYSNGQYRSPWLFHNNTDDGNSYLIPMNEKGVKHNLGRGDKHFSKTYTDTLYLGKESRDVGIYLWDIITCFGIIARYGWDLKNSSVQGHVRGVFTKYGFK
nr:MAG TPA: tail protein [Caudoviricetes sp.]